MSFSWQQFAELAVQLAAERRDEASQRTVISRAYYAAYHAASSYVRAEGLAPSDQQLRHDRVWRHIRDSRGPYCNVVAQLGFNLRDARVRADYKNPYPGNLDSEANDAIAFSIAMVTMLRESQPAADS